MTYPEIDTLNAETIKSLSPEGLRDLTVDLVWTLHLHGANGLFEGAMEMADASSVAMIKADLWGRVQASGNVAQAVNSNREPVDRIDMLEDSSLQELAARVMDLAAENAPEAFAGFATLGFEDWVDIATQIEEWETRHEPE